MPNITTIHVPNRYRGPITWVHLVFDLAVTLTDSEKIKLEDGRISRNIKTLRISEDRKTIDIEMDQSLPDFKGINVTVEFTGESKPKLKVEESSWKRPDSAGGDTLPVR